MKNRHRQFVIDGEAVLLGADGVFDFNGLHSGEHNDQVQLYALEGEDLRALPLSMRKTNLAPAVRASTGRHLRFEQDEIGPDLFRAACNTGPEGIVSKRADRPYRAGRSRDWVVKVKNRRLPAYRRVQDQKKSASLKSNPQMIATSDNSRPIPQKIRTPLNESASTFFLVNRERV